MKRVDNKFPLVVILFVGDKYSTNESVWPARTWQQAYEHLSGKNLKQCIIAEIKETYVAEKEGG